jgi:DNA-binding NtrC family response regulator
MEPRPDIVLLGTQWRPRALLRAQLIEEGFEVVATETWPDARRHLRPGMKPRLLIVDVQQLPDAAQVLADLRVLMKPDRVLVLSAMSTVSDDEIQRLGFHAVKRPIAIEQIVDAVTRIIGGDSSET